ncbi:MAG: GNAT family N-acetyltransferase, partial [Gammaproteobacteria bacterium]
AETGRFVGHIAGFSRRFRMNGTDLRGLVLGDLLVHRDWRRGGLGRRLITTPVSLVQGRRFDFVLAFSFPRAFPRAHPLFLKLGFRDLGPFREYVDLRHSAATLRRHLAPAALLSPPVDALLALRRWLYHRRRGLAKVSRRWRVERAKTDEIATAGLHHWRGPPDRIASNDSYDFIIRRYFTDPGVSHALFAIRHGATGRLDGYAIVGLEDRRPTVFDCRTNAEFLDVPTAVTLVGARLPPHNYSYVVATTDGWLGRELSTCGFIKRPTSSDAPFFLLAYWELTHPLAAKFAVRDNWTLFLGAAEF